MMPRRETRGQAVVVEFMMTCTVIVGVITGLAYTGYLPSADEAEAIKDTFVLEMTGESVARLIDDYATRLGFVQITFKPSHILAKIVPAEEEKYALSYSEGGERISLLGAYRDEYEGRTYLTVQVSKLVDGTRVIIPSKDDRALFPVAIEEFSIGFSKEAVAQLELNVPFAPHWLHIKARGEIIEIPNRWW